MQKHVLFIVFYLFVGFSSATAQLSISDIKKEADNFVKHRQYLKALKLYERIQQIKPSEKLDLFKVGLSYYQTNQLSQARRNFVLLLNQENKPDPLAQLYLANIYHQELDYKQAINFYKIFLKKAGDKHDMAPYAIDQIKRCATGTQLTYAEQLAYVENMGSTLNSIYDEILPMPSPNYGDKLYFSAIREGNTGGPKNEKGERDLQYGKFLSDMFTADLNQGVWSNPRPLNKHLNTNQHEYLLGFRDRGKLIYFQRSGYDSQISYVDTFVQQVDSFYQSHTGRWMVNFGVDDMGAIQFYNDTTMLFSSRALAGYGGYDIFISKLRAGYWSTPENLGPEVNTAFDEISPFLTLDGRGLYFSSNRLTSIGGFDVFKIKYNDRDQKWHRVENLKAPINSASNDIHFRIDNDGSRAWFASSRVEGYGGYDLYSCFFKQKVPEHLATSAPLTFDLVKTQSLTDVIVEEGSGVDGSTTTQPIFSSDEIRDFKVSPLYYEENDFMMSTANVKTIDRYVSLLKSYPELNILLTAHSDDRDPAEFDQYFSVKRAEKLAQEIINKGVPSGRIFVRGVGSLYPVAVNSQNNIPYRAGQGYNRRIEFMILNADNMPINIKYENAAISERVALSEGDKYKSRNKGLTYRVKLASANQPFRQAVFLNDEHRAVEKYMNANTYDFVIGIYDNYILAKNKKAQAMGAGLNSVNIIPYIDGHRVSRSKLQKMSTTYPDITYYLEDF